MGPAVAWIWTQVLTAAQGFYHGVILLSQFRPLPSKLQLILSSNFQPDPPSSSSYGSADYSEKKISSDYSMEKDNLGRTSAATTDVLSHDKLKKLRNQSHHGISLTSVKYLLVLTLGFSSILDRAASSTPKGGQLHPNVDLILKERKWIFFSHCLFTVARPSFGLPPHCPPVLWCHWGEIEPFSATVAQNGLAECDQPGKDPLKYSATAGN